MAEHDVVVIGAGHNGLTVAAYLAKAGLDVCVIDGNNRIGGNVFTKELTLPGFKHDPGTMSQSSIPGSPLYKEDELGLRAKYGLKYITPTDAQFALVFPDNSALIMYRDIDKTCKSIEQFSKRDAEVYPYFYEMSSQLLQAASISQLSPPPSFGTFVSFLEASEEGRELLRVILNSPLDLAEDWFESEQMKALVCDAAANQVVSPRDKGSGVYALALSAIHRGFPIPEGGAGMLCETLAACAKDYGATIRLSSPVVSLKVTSGECQAVILETGEEIVARKVIASTINIKQIFLNMVPAEELPSGFQLKVKRLKHSPFTTMCQLFSLNEAPKWKVGGDVNQTLIVHFGPSIEGVLKTADNFNYGIPNTEALMAGVATLFDPTRAPDGKHTLRMVQGEPWSLKDGGPEKWDEIKQEVADGALETLRAHTTNMGVGNILEREVISPLDFTRWNPAMVGGDIHQIGSYLSQYLSNRPLPGWGNYRTPVTKLYMCGSSTHPGGATTCGGRAAVQVIMEDLGIDFKKVVTA